MIDITKQYKTEDGRTVKLYSTDGVGLFYVHGAVLRPDGKWDIAAWDREGLCYYGARIGASSPRDCDLVEVRPPFVRELWVNVYPNPSNSVTYCTQRDANAKAGLLRIACVKVVIEGKEGDGL